MDGNTYNVRALKFEPEGHSRTKRLIHAAMGLTGEVGEVVDAVKKVQFGGRDLDRLALLKEIGDVAWYLNLLACEGTWETWITEANKMKSTDYSILASQDFDGFDLEQIASAMALAQGTQELVDLLVADGLGILGPADDDDDALCEATTFVVITLTVIIDQLGSTWEEVWAMNIAKLESRYKGGGFNPDLAINRDTAVEDAAVKAIVK